MKWMLNGLMGAISTLVALFFRAVGAIMDYFARGIFKFVLKILGATIFRPFTLVNANHTLSPVGTVANEVWATMALISAGVALVMILMGVVSRHILTGLNGQQSWTEIGEGLAVWMAVLVGGWGFLNVLLGISNAATGALSSTIQNIIPIITQYNGSVAGTGSSLGLATVVTALIWPLSAILMVALLIWAVGVWLMRQVDLVLYAGLLPLMAAIGIGGNKTPFKWAWSETMGAVFNQMAMAFIMWIGFLFLKNQPKNTVLEQFIDILLAISTFTLMARSGQILGNITGHRSAGSGHLIAGMATGYLAGKGLQTAVKATPMGQAVGKAMEGQTARSAAKVTSWAGRSSVGEKLGNTGVGQRVKNWAHTTAESARASIGNSAVGQKVKDFADAHETIAGGVKKAGQMVGQGVKGATAPVRTAASMMYQPMTTLGRMASRGQADSGRVDKGLEGPAGTMNRSAEATMYMAQNGVHKAAGQFFPADNGTANDASYEKLGQLTNSIITRDPIKGGTNHTVNFAQGSWQGQLYKDTMQSPLQQMPVTAQKPKDQRVYG